MNLLSISSAAGIAGWLADFYQATGLLLLFPLVARRWIRQPAHRLTLAWIVGFESLALAAICALPGWPRVSLHSPRDAKAVVNSPAFVENDPAPLPEPHRVKRLPRELAGPTSSHPVIDAPCEAAEPVAPPAVSRRVWSWTEMLAAAYLAGAAAAGLWLGCGAAAAAGVCRGARPAGDSLRAELAKLTGPRRGPRLLISRRVKSAVALGLLRPTIVLPDSLAQASPRVLRAVLAHEWAHVRNGDLWLLALTRALSLLLFAHPLFWWLRRTIRADQELLADAAAAGDDRPGYAEELVRLLRESIGPPPVAVSASVGIWEGRSQLSRRIAMLLDETFRIQFTVSRRWQCAAAGVLLVPGAALSLTTFQPARARGEAPNSFAVADQASPSVLPSGETATVAGVDLYGDPLPSGAIARLGTVRYPFLHPIAFAPDSRTIIGILGAFTPDESLSASIGRLDARTGKLVRNENPGGKFHHGSVVTPDGKIAVAVERILFGKLGETGPPSFRLTWRDTATGEQLAWVPCDHNDWLRCVSADGNIAVTGNPNMNATIRIWDRKTRKQTDGFHMKHGDQCSAISPDGKSVAFVTWEEGVRLWSFAAGQAPKTILASSKGFQPFKVTFSPDGKTLAVGGFRGDLKLVDVASARVFRTFKWKHPCPDAITFSPDGRRIALADAGVSNDHLAVWELASGKLLHHVDGFSGGGVNGMAFSPDGHFLAVGRDSLKVWDLASGECLSDRFPGHSGWIEPAVFLGRSNTVATAGGDGAVRLWDARTGRQKLSIQQEDSIIRDLAVSPDGKLLATSLPTGFVLDEMGEDGCAVRIWDAETGKKLHELAGRKKLKEVWRLNFSADGKRLAGVDTGGIVRVWNVDDGSLTSEIELESGLRTNSSVRDDPFGEEDMSHSLFSPDDDWIVINGREAKVRVFSVKTGKELQTFGDDGVEALHMAMTQDEKRLLAIEYGVRIQPKVYEVRLWDLSSGKEIWHQNLPPDLPSGVSLGGPLAISADGARFAVPVAAATMEIKIGDLATGQFLQTIKLDHQPRSMTFSPDGRLLVAGMYDGTAITWYVSQSAAAR